MFPYPRTDSSYGFSDGCAERGEAVQEGDTNLELRDLTAFRSSSLVPMLIRLMPTPQTELLWEHF